MSTHFVAFGNDELAKLPALDNKILCLQCGKMHEMFFSKQKLDDGREMENKTIAGYRCRGKLYLAGVDGKNVTSCFVKKRSIKMPDEKVQPEMKGLIEAINRWVVVNGNEVSFVGSFVAFDEEGEVRDDSERMFVYGSRETLLIQLDALKEELEKDKHEFVNW